MKTILRKISNTLFSILLISAGIGLELLLLSITKYQLDLSDITQNFQQSLLNSGCFHTLRFYLSYSD